MDCPSCDFSGLAPLGSRISSEIYPGVLGDGVSFGDVQRRHIPISQDDRIFISLPPLLAFSLPGISIPAFILFRSDPTAGPSERVDHFSKTTPMSRG